MKCPSMESFLIGDGLLEIQRFIVMQLRNNSMKFLAKRMLLRVPTGMHLIFKFANSFGKKDKRMLKLVCVVSFK